MQKSTVILRAEDIDVLREVLVTPDFTDDQLAVGVTQVGPGRAFSVESEVLQALNIDAGNRLIKPGKVFDYDSFDWSLLTGAELRLRDRAPIVRVEPNQTRQALP